MYSSWIPSNHQILDLSNPFNLLGTFSPVSSTYSWNASNHPQQRHEWKPNDFEPLPFVTSENQIHNPQLSQKHAAIKQMIAQRSKPMSFTSGEHMCSSANHRTKRRICTFCKSNGESAHVYSSHVLRNAANELECPVLLAYVCPRCGATGPSAHTIKYCPSLSECERVALPTVKLFKEGRSSSGNQNLFKN